MLPTSGMPPERLPSVDTAAAGTQPIRLQLLSAKNLAATVLRLDLIHPVISGNKWFKLRHHLEAARRKGSTRLLTFGGAYSNHLVATACAARQQGIEAVGIVRGERPPNLSHTLVAAEGYGMKLHFMDRESYSVQTGSPNGLAMQDLYPGSYLIPEGGAGPEGVQGCRDILPLAENAPLYTHVMCCIGTGTMFRGITDSLNEGQQLIGIPVLKLPAEAPLVQSLYHHAAVHNKQVSIQAGFEWGGYARQKKGLLQFMDLFYAQTGIPTDFVYTGKLMWAFMQLAERDFFPPGSRILLIHSGGLQGNGSLPRGSLRYQDNSLT